MIDIALPHTDTPHSVIASRPHGVPYRLIALHRGVRPALPEAEASLVGGLVGARDPADVVAHSTNVDW